MKDFAHWQGRHEFKWTDIDSGEVLTKFIATDEGESNGDYTVTIHGFRDSEGRFYITDEIVIRSGESEED